LLAGRMHAAGSGEPVMTADDVARPAGAENFILYKIESMRL
ncbi:PEP phosphonomutase family protein, partial [human gut metagenome]